MCKVFVLHETPIVDTLSGEEQPPTRQEGLVEHIILLCSCDVLGCFTLFVGALSLELNGA